MVLPPLFRAVCTCGRKFMGPLNGTMPEQFREHVRECPGLPSRVPAGLRPRGAG